MVYRKTDQIWNCCSGTEIVSRVVVVRNGREVYTHAGDCPDIAFEWIDTEPCGDCAIVSDDGTPFLYYYVRVEQADGELA